MNTMTTGLPTTFKSIPLQEDKPLTPEAALEKLTSSLGPIQASRNAAAAARALAEPKAIVPILPGLSITNKSLSAADLKSLNVSALVTMRITEADESLKSALTRDAGLSEKRIAYVAVSHDDDEDLVKYFAQVCDFIDSVASTRLKRSVKPGEFGLGLGKILSQEGFEKMVAEEEEEARKGGEGGVLIHCNAGWEKVVAIVVAYMMRRYGVWTGEVLQFVKRKMALSMKGMNKKKYSVSNGSLKEQLGVWCQVGFKPYTEAGVGEPVPKGPYQQFLKDQRNSKLIDLWLVSMGVTTGRPSPYLLQTIKPRR